VKTGIQSFQTVLEKRGTAPDCFVPSCGPEKPVQLPIFRKEEIGSRPGFSSGVGSVFPSVFDGSNDGRLTIHLPLVNGSKNYYTLYLEKDVVRDPLKPFTLRRVEHLRSSLVATLKRLDEKNREAAPHFLFLTLHTPVCFIMTGGRRNIMQTETARINVTLPRDVIESLNQIAGPRSRSRLIAESLREYIRQMKVAELGKRLEEGYCAAAAINVAMTAEFEAVDLEGWDEY
jgi:CopG family transcriptional regulator / antitoxin EndoAI